MNKINDTCLFILRAKCLKIILNKHLNYPDMAVFQI